jgi:hypothetical protein
MLAILSKSIAIIDSDTAEKSIADSDTSKVSPILSLIDINNPAENLSKGYFPDEYLGGYGLGGPYAMAPSMVLATVRFCH